MLYFLASYVDFAIIKYIISFIFSYFRDGEIVTMSKKDEKQKPTTISDKAETELKHSKSNPENTDDVSSERKDKTSDLTELEICKQELVQVKDQYLRAKADFENFKRRIEKEQTQWYRAAQAQLMLDLLEIVDNFDRALEETQKQEQSEQFKAWLEGFELIHKSLHKLLSDYEIEEIAVDSFDPHLHEAVSQIKSEEHKSGEIVEVMQKGYTFKGEVLRPAKVTVAQ